MMLGGYAGQLLRVNLTTGRCETEPLPDESELRKYVGVEFSGGNPKSAPTFATARPSLDW